MLKSIHKRPKFIQTIIIKKSEYGSFLGVSTFTLEERKRGFLRSRIKKGLSETSKNWGETYPVSSRTLPLVFRLNARYKPLIEEYIRYGRESKYPLEYALQVILENAIINYLDQ